MKILRLRAIETVGFKSFADKIELNFVDGITAIVGPNGSGKSNVSDAIRWVLGEQSMKTLRGSSMEDVIFSGSGKRRALNIAEVTLHFTNINGTLPVEYQEVSVCRRLFRSGDSAYFINKAPCRLKDIHDLFADTGLGKGSLSIIGQNKVDEILNGRPEDRRAVFEEAAGIVRHKLRKREAVKRLEETDNNLIRLNDIRSEISERLEPMRESAEKTQKHNLLQGQLKECKITQSVRKIDNAEKMLKTAQIQMDELNGQEAAFSAQININENKSFMLRQQLDQIAQRLTQKQQQINELQSNLEKIAGQKSVLFERIVQNQDRSNSVDEDIKRLQEQYEELKRQKSDFAQRLDSQKESELTARQDKLELEEVLSIIAGNIKSIESAQSEEQTAIIERKRNIMQLSNDLRLTQSEFVANERKQEKLAKELEEGKQKLDDFAEELSKYNEKLASFQEQKQNILFKIKEIKEEEGFAEKNLSQLMGKEKNLTDTAISLKTRINILEKMQSEYDGFSHSVKRLMNAEDKWRNGIIGAVGQLINVPAQFVFAIETALGGSVQNIVTQDDITAQQAIEFLKEQKAGRATFLPLNRLRQPSFAKEEDLLLQQQGILGRADKLIDCEQNVRQAIEFLLARTIIAENLNAAVQANRKGNTRFRIVTLEGDVIYAAGSMSGGSRTNKESGFLSRKQEIIDNKNKLIDFEKQLQEIILQKAQGKNLLEQCEQKIKELLEQVKNIDFETVKLTTQQSEMQKVQKQFALGFDAIKFEYDESVKEKQELVGKLENLAADKKQAELEDEDKIIASGQAKMQLDEFREQHSKLANDYNEANVRYETAKNATKLLQEQHDGMKERVTQLVNDKKRLENDVQSFTENIKQAEQEKAQLEKESSEKQRQLEQAKLELDETAGKQVELMPVQKQLEKQAKEIKEELIGVQSRLRNADSIFVRYQTEHELAINQLAESYQMIIEQAREFCQEGLADKELASKIVDLENNIEEIGPVNPAAIGEYNEIKERYDFMSLQYQDLIKAKEDLQILLREIDNTMIRRFKEAFNAINTHFGDCFSRLFGGGLATLKLIEPANILTTGIDIIVQPPGKKLQNLSLLSGGERAFTVIALLFALLSYKPSPFCVLDEIDAALDEANVDRFKNFVVDFAKDTQFVIITHRKATMQAADLLHGITMEETGVSKLVSLKIKEREEAMA